MSRAPRVLIALAVALAAAMPVAAQEDVATTTISAIERGEAEAMAYLEGAILEQLDEASYLFSDGTGVIMLDLEEPAEGGPPLFELIGVEGAVTPEAIAVSRWVPLRIVTPAVIVEEPQVIEAFRGWIIAYGSQAPTSTE